MKQFTFFKKLFLLVFTLFFLSTKSFAFENILSKITDAKYIFCMDGGATKTELRVLDEYGQELLLFKNKNKEGSYSLKGGSSNITAYSPKEVKEVLSSLLTDTLISENKTPALTLANQSAFIGGFAGCGHEDAKHALEKIIQDLGFDKKRMGIFTDAGLSTELTNNLGGILIGGTGSVCFVKKENKLHRYGGLGYRLNDDGSGYLMGIHAIKAAIESEYDPTESTTLTDPIKEHFKVKNATDLIKIINKSEESPARIGAVAKIVFDQAAKGDLKSNKIILDAANDLGALLSKAISKTDLKNATVYLIGGLFQSQTANKFISLIYSSDSMKQLTDEQKPLLINLSKEMIPSIAVQEALLSQNKLYSPLSSLPITRRSSFKEFKKEFQNDFISTEKPNLKAKYLSQIFQKDMIEGLELLQLLDHSVLTGTEAFVDHHLEHLVDAFINTIQQNGRIFFIGAGSSGRLSLDLAAKWRDFFSKKNVHLPSSLKDSIQAIIAGGPGSFVTSREKFEDSVKSGYKALKNAKFNSKDLAILVSASGSAHFNVGAANFAHECGASSYYFCNSQKVPERTQELFERKITKPLVVDIGPQSITGSTRLQAASLDELCLGITLESIIEKLTYGNHLDVKKVGHKLIQNLQIAWESVSDNIPEIAKIINLEVDVFSNPNANFWKARDETSQGFVTFLAASDSLREIMIDTTESAPTFSTNPPRYDKIECGKKKAEFRAFLAGSNSNLGAWENLMGHKLTPFEINQVSNLLLSSKAEGYGSYSNRIESEGNLLVGVLKSCQDREKALELISEMRLAKYKGLKLASILLEEKKCSFENEAKQMINFSDACVVLKKIPKDYLGITVSLALKQTLNLISNGTMICMNKVYGNTMIDLSPSNNKLIDRSIRIIQQIYAEHHPESEILNYEILFHYVTRAFQYKKIMEKLYGNYVPSSTKLALTMLEKNCSVNEAITFLDKHNGNIHKLYEEI